jgi:hypothetical protein
MENYKGFMEANSMSFDEDKKYAYTESYDLILCKYQNKKNNAAIALVFGKIFGYMMRGSKGCFCASKEKLANELFIDVSTAKDIIDLLLQDQLILDITPEEYKSRTQVRHYIANLQEFRKLKLTKREKKISLNKKNKEEAIRKKKDSLFEQWGIKQNEDD